MLRNARMEKILAKMEKVRMEKFLAKMEKIIVSLPMEALNWCDVRRSFALFTQ